MLRIVDHIVGMRRPLLLFVFAFTLLMALNSSLAQSSQPKVPVGKSDYALADEKVSVAREGNLSATIDLAHEMFRNAGIPSQAADAFGYTTRVVQAHRDYLQGKSHSLHEEDIVAAINRFATTLRLPAWAHTNQEEARKLRIHLFLAMPQLFGNHEAPDANHHHQLVSANMSPMEAGYIASTLLYMKAFNPKYQFSDAERSEYKSQGATVLTTERKNRLALMQKIVTGHSDSVSVIDILPAADQLFTDLGMPQSSNLNSKVQLLPNMFTTKGGL